MVTKRSLLVDGTGVGASLDCLGGKLLPELVELAKEAVRASRVGLAIPLLVVPAGSARSRVMSVM
jgi:hypothetical protein